MGVKCNDSYMEYGYRQSSGQNILALGKREEKAWVSGQFMLAISEKEIQGIAPGFLERLDKYLRRWLDA